MQASGLIMFLVVVITTYHSAQSATIEKPDDREVLGRSAGLETAYQVKNRIFGKVWNSFTSAVADVHNAIWKGHDVYGTQAAGIRG